MRTKNSIKNMIGSLASNIITIIIGLLAQAVFIKILGTEYLGINGLFTNIISMLGIVELGIGSAITYNLYKPIANNDTELIKSLMYFYKKSYFIIGIIVLLIGISLLPFLNVFVGKITIDINLELVYILFIIDIVCSYFLSYKRSILYASQKNYLINICHIIYILLLNIVQIIVLYLTKNYYLYLFVKIIIHSFENILINIIANKKYKFINEKNIKKLDKEIEKDIFSKIKALFFHKIGGFIVLGTDNILISTYFGIVYVGLYSNYYLIINAVKTVFGQIISSTTASIGNLLATENKKKCFEVFKKIRFINFWMSCFTSISLMVIMQSFIKIWIGEEYLLSEFVLISLVICYFQQSMRNCYAVFKDSAGIFVEDKFIPIIESLINIIFSIIFLKIFGLAGIFIGTIFSSIVLWCYSYPKFIYKKLFNRNYINYIKETIYQILLFIFLLFITYIISQIYIFNNIYLELFKNILICLIIPNILLMFIFKNNSEYIYYKNFVCNFLKKRCHK